MDAASSGHLPQSKTAVNDQLWPRSTWNISSHVSMRTINKHRTVTHWTISRMRLQHPKLHNTDQAWLGTNTWGIWPERALVCLLPCPLHFSFRQTHTLAKESGYRLNWVQFSQSGQAWHEPEQKLQAGNSLLRRGPCIFLTLPGSQTAWISWGQQRTTAVLCHWWGWERPQFLGWPHSGLNFPFCLPWHIFFWELQFCFEMGTLHL